MSANGSGFEDGWTVTTLEGVKPTRFKLEKDNSQVVVKATAEAAPATVRRVKTHSILSWCLHSISEWTCPLSPRSGPPKTTSVSLQAAKIGQ